MIRMRTLTVISAAGLAASISLAGCGAQGGSDANPTQSPPVTPTAPQLVRVLANPKNCDMQPLLVAAGPITVTATSTADIPISVSLFAPEEGAFRKRIARIRVLRPGDTKTMSAELAQGAYEMACGTEVLESRKRLTAI
ncbi:MAG: hypothetical protein WBZ04_06365 [Candidatus Nanopelagicales bacterium]|jgi:hypothetical protein